MNPIPGLGLDSAAFDAVDDTIARLRAYGLVIEDFRPLFEADPVATAKEMLASGPQVTLFSMRMTPDGLPTLVGVSPEHPGFDMWQEDWTELNRMADWWSTHMENDPTAN